MRIGLLTLDVTSAPPRGWPRGRRGSRRAFWRGADRARPRARSTAESQCGLDFRSPCRPTVHGVGAPRGRLWATPWEGATPVEARLCRPTVRPLVGRRRGRSLPRRTLSAPLRACSGSTGVTPDWLLLACPRAVDGTALRGAQEALGRPIECSQGISLGVVERLRLGVSSEVVTGDSPTSTSPRLSLRLSPPCPPSHLQRTLNRAAVFGGPPEPLPRCLGAATPGTGGRALAGATPLEARGRLAGPPRRSWVPGGRSRQRRVRANRAGRLGLECARRNVSTSVNRLVSQLVDRLADRHVIRHVRSREPARAHA